MSNRMPGPAIPFTRLRDLNDEPNGPLPIDRTIEFIPDHGAQDAGTQRSGVYIKTPQSEFGAELEAVLRKHFGAMQSPSKIQAAIAVLWRKRHRA